MDKQDFKKYEMMRINSLLRRGIFKKVTEAMAENARLTEFSYELRNRYYRLEDEFNEYIRLGSEKLFSKHPHLREYFENRHAEEDNQYARTRSLLADKGEEVALVERAFSEIPELIHANEIDREMECVGLERLTFHAVHRKFYERIRAELFGEDYISELDSHAERGIFFYNYIVPDIPFSLVSDEELLDRFFALEVREFIEEHKELSHIGASLERKIEDIKVAYDLIEKGNYRSAARNLFSLIEAEHKKGADAFSGIFEAEEKLMGGKARSEKLNGILSYPTLEWEKRTFEKIEKYYVKVFGNKPQGVVHRNSIMHGDYTEESLFVTRYDAIKLFTLFINLKFVADRLCIEAENIRFLIPHVAKMTSDIAADGYAEKQQSNSAKEESPKENSKKAKGENSNHKGANKEKKQNRKKNQNKSPVAK